MSETPRSPFCSSCPPHDKVARPGCGVCERIAAGILNPNESAPAASPSERAPSGIVVEAMGGMCPVQATGTIDGSPFYFRARGDAWSVEIGPGNTSCVVDAMEAARHNKSKDGSHETPRDAGDRVGKLPVWSYGEDYGTWPEAGYMEHDEARAFIAKAADLWRRSLTDTTGTPT